MLSLQLTGFCFSFSRERAVKELISRNSVNITKEVEEILLNNLRIPAEWIAEAKVC